MDLDRTGRCHLVLLGGVDQLLSTFQVKIALG